MLLDVVEMALRQGRVKSHVCLRGHKIILEIKVAGVAYSSSCGILDGKCAEVVGLSKSRPVAFVSKDLGRNFSQPWRKNLVVFVMTEYPIDNRVCVIPRASQER